jgi:hypothetical protein
VVADTPIGVTADGPEVTKDSRFAVVPETWGQDLVAPIAAVTPKLPWPIHPALMVARGDLDVAVQVGGQIWDFAATSLIVSEAGGSFSSLSGRREPGPGASIYARSEPLRQATLDLLAEGATHADADADAATEGDAEVATEGDAEVATDADAETARTGPATTPAAAIDETVTVIAAEAASTVAAGPGNAGTYAASADAAGSDGTGVIVTREDAAGPDGGGIYTSRAYAAGADTAAEDPAWAEGADTQVPVGAPASTPDSGVAGKGAGADAPRTVSAAAAMAAIAAAASRAAAAAGASGKGKGKGKAADVVPAVAGPRCSDA